MIVGLVLDCVIVLWVSFVLGLSYRFFYIFLTLVRLHFSFCFWLVGLFLKIVVGRLSCPL